MNKLPSIQKTEVALEVEKSTELNLKNFKDLSSRVAHAQNLLRYRDILLKRKKEIDRYSRSHEDFYTEIKYCLIELTTDPNVMRGLNKQKDQLSTMIRSAILQMIEIQLSSIDEDLRALNVGL